jgi:ankyrin repeat protein
MKRLFNRSTGIPRVLTFTVLASCFAVIPAGAQDVTSRIETMNSLVREGNLTALKTALEADPKIVAHWRSQSLLYNALQSGKTDIVKFLLEKKLDPNGEIWGNYPLSMAIQFWDEQWKPMSELLIENGANINLTDGEGMTPLHRALRNGGNSQKDKVNWLLSKGADINLRNRYGQNALETALSNSSAPLIPLLLEKTDVKKGDENGNTPLFSAVKLRSLEAVKLILEKGADVNARNLLGETALHLAADIRGPFLGPLLEAGARTDIKSNRGDLPLHIALRRRDDDQLTPGAPERSVLIAPLLEKSDINAKDQFGVSPLLLAILARDLETRDLIAARSPKMDSTTQLFDAVSQGNLAVVKTLLAQKPFLVYFRLPDGSTPLHVAAAWGTLGAAQLLVQKGADVNARDSRGETPLMEALWRPTGLYARRAKNMVAFLIEKGANPGALDVDDSSPLHRAVKTGDAEFVGQLLTKNVNVNERDKLGRTPIFALMTPTVDINLVRTLLDKGASVDVRPSEDSGASLLARAVMTSRLDLVQLLIDRGADVNAKDAENRTPLTMMLSSGNQGADAVAVAELLLAKGANPNEKVWGDTLISRIISSDAMEMLRVILASKRVNLKAVGDRESPLFQSINYNRNQMIPMLLEAGADPTEVNEQGKTVAEVAAQRSKELGDLFKPKTAPAG